MGLTLTDLCAILLNVALALLLRSRLKEKNNLPFPPGSDIIYLEGPGLSLIVLNSVKSATDLLGERSAIYSSRSALHGIVVAHVLSTLWEVMDGALPDILSTLPSTPPIVPFIDHDSLPMCTKCFYSS
ncbi:uncharacterized protein LACBIDRAFT_329733 [Laccaria bicolor S238N-H82]|uniref:Predicted protein n=1 Tax=Laccaria bicolor (strain S238N-H82 / ATCC MYA-4686) TaxID=486041 RepID=B0DJ24_LACBS|nr:uncharacterized protein LACBIDRAFT_329733 [Laccaria bicolor S238N-H82]EDR05329.1 predicted protein [Laccaria bicolor S238N-H82]|eukprot:XP_001883887.1 predicted protein [Laccaria bicolor S238N-H82]